jgi:pyruvate/2-oxoglutarate dehydrogenase complex dihydrolipoamide dehydrogenase (E3) component
MKIYQTSTAVHLLLTSPIFAFSSINTNKMKTSPSSTWDPKSESHIQDAKQRLHIWPLDEANTSLLNQVHPKEWPHASDDTIYDLISIGAGAGGLVSSRQTARRGGKSCMISASLAGGDCLNVGCVPSKALIQSAKLIRQVHKAKHDEFGVTVGQVTIDFDRIMQRMRELRAEIAPIDGHERGEEIGTTVYQGFGSFVNENTVQVTSHTGETIQLKFKKAAICTGGRATIPQNIKGLNDAPYVTNETLFNLQMLPKHMVILGSGVVALEMAQCFSTFGSKVTILVRSNTLFPNSDAEAGPELERILTKDNDNIEFLKQATLSSVQTLSNPTDVADLPLMKLTIDVDGTTTVINDCDCLLIAAGRTANVEKLNLEAANVQYDSHKGVIVDDYARSVSNPNIYSVGDCTADVPRLTHMSGEMAKVVVNNALFEQDWKLSSLVVPSCMYTEPEFATVGNVRGGDDVDVYKTSLEHNDRAILDSDREGYVKIFCKKGTGEIIGGSIIASRAGEIINEVSLAMKYGISLEEVGRNIHCYPTTGEAVMGCGLQLINSKWKRL